MPAHNELRNLLASVADIGVAHVRKRELLFFLGRKRYTPSVWNEVQEHWAEIGEGIPLLVGEAEGAWAFAWGEGLTTSSTSWFQDISTRSTPSA